MSVAQGGDTRQRHPRRAQIFTSAVHLRQLRRTFATGSFKTRSSALYPTTVPLTCSCNGRTAPPAANHRAAEHVIPSPCWLQSSLLHRPPCFSLAESLRPAIIPITTRCQRSQRSSTDQYSANPLGTANSNTDTLGSTGGVSALVCGQTCYSCASGLVPGPERDHLHRSINVLLPTPSSAQQARPAGISGVLDTTSTLTATAATGLCEQLCTERHTTSGDFCDLDSGQLTFGSAMPAYAALATRYNGVVSGDPAPVLAIFGPLPSSPKQPLSIQTAAVALGRARGSATSAETDTRFAQVMPHLSILRAVRRRLPACLMAAAVVCASAPPRLSAASSREAQPRNRSSASSAPLDAQRKARQARWQLEPAATTLLWPGEQPFDSTPLSSVLFGQLKTAPQPKPMGQRSPCLWPRPPKHRPRSEIEQGHPMNDNLSTSTVLSTRPLDLGR